ncbi:hypothetical protein EVAR_44723_1 [Eumeta japonica]|uniref:Lysosomal-associated transmembrane protein 4B n=1 Tax=Eumeta variegata TaxID=151549 RepID=A0A4C1XKR2_EUMVA|nr:hypothetical protein EVAR_44723_1 [Eumeta japonica]
MRRLQNCCCCASVRTGTLVTSVLGVVLSILTIVLLWISNRSAFKIFFFDDDLDRKITDMDIPRIILTVSLIFTIIICLLLFVGVQKRRSWLMLPWVVLGIVLAIGLLISVLHTSITYYLDGKDNWRIATAILIGGILYLCVYLYLWVVVFSHYLDVRDEEERGQYRKAPYRRR